MMHLNLKQILFDEYKGFADKRIKNLNKSNSFIVDDRSDTDIGADKSLYSYFCQIRAEVVSDTEILLTLHDNIPMSPPVMAWIEQHMAEYTKGRVTTLSIVVKQGEQAKLLGLADAIASIVAPGMRYKVKNYKHVCPRVAKALQRLKKTLDKAWRT